MHLCTAASDLHLGCGIALSFEDHSLAASTCLPGCCKKGPGRGHPRRGLGSADLSRGRLVMPSYSCKSPVGDLFLTGRFDEIERPDPTAGAGGERRAGSQAEKLGRTIFLHLPVTSVIGRERLCELLHPVEIGTGHGELRWPRHCSQSAPPL
jgi:hypothetical protein